MSGALTKPRDSFTVAGLRSGGGDTTLEPSAARAKRLLFEPVIDLGPLKLMDQTIIATDSVTIFCTIASGCRRVTRGYNAIL